LIWFCSKRSDFYNNQRLFRNYVAKYNMGGVGIVDLHCTDMKKYSTIDFGYKNYFRIER